MADRGDTIENPVQGVRVTFRETTRDTAGEYVPTLTASPSDAEYGGGRWSHTACSRSL